MVVSNVEFFAGPSTAILITRRTDAARQSAEEAISTIYSLSPAERRVLSGILAGKRLREIAASNGVGLETVRSQLKAIHFKTGLNSQAGLVRVASGLSQSNDAGGKATPR